MVANLRVLSDDLLRVAHSASHCLLPVHFQ